MALDLLRFYEDNKFKFDDKLAYGIYRNRVISILPSGSYVKITIPFSRQLLKEQGQKISNELRAIKENNRALQHAVTTNVYVELIIYQSADINEEFFPIFNACLDVLDNNQIGTCEICPICGQLLHTNDPFVRIRDSVLQGHQNCIEQFLSTTSKLEESTKQKENKGIGSTLLISALCMIFFVLLCSAMSFVNAYGYFVFLSGFGFVLLVNYLMRKFKVPMGKKQMVVVSIFAFLSIVLSVYLGSAIDLYKFSTLELSLIEILKNYFVIFINNYEAFGKGVMFDILINTFGVAILIYSYSKMLKKRTPNVHKL